MKRFEKIEAALIVSLLCAALVGGAFAGVTYTCCKASSIYHRLVAREARPHDGVPDTSFVSSYTLRTDRPAASAP
jgi:hypothetical protein